MSLFQFRGGREIRPFLFLLSKQSRRPPLEGGEERMWAGRAFRWNSYVDSGLIVSGNLRTCEGERGLATVDRGLLGGFVRERELVSVIGRAG